MIRYIDYHISLYLLFIISLVFCQSRKESSFIEIKTESGTLRGRSSLIRDKEIISFLGIQYAKPPIGDRRFAAPEYPPDPWSGTKDALKYGDDCYGFRDDTFPGFDGAEMWNA